jgi:hypothetical protein
MEQPLTQRLPAALNNLNSSYSHWALTFRAELRRSLYRVDSRGDFPHVRKHSVNHPAVKRLVLLLGAIAFAASVVTSAEPNSKLRAKAETGDAESQAMLGSAYDFGIDEPPNSAEAVKWYRKAAEQGHTIAQLNLGIAYANGRGVPRNEIEAVGWYRKAANQGLAQAQLNLGVCLANGTGVAKDEQEAFKWIRKAAQLGWDYAQHNLGLCYANGSGTPKDLVEAYAHFNLSAVTNAVARTWRDGLEKTLSREEIAAGQQRSRELREEIEARRGASAANR